MNQSDGAQIWNGIRELLIQSSWRLAYGKDPWVIYASSRDDLDRSGQQTQTEQQFAEQTDQFLREFIRTRDFPKKARNVVRFYAGQRIDWACNFLRIILATNRDGKPVFQPPALGPTEFLEWLLITAYRSRFQPQARLTHTFSSADKALNGIWS